MVNRSKYEPSLLRENLRIAIVFRTDELIIAKNYTADLVYSKFNSRVRS